MISVQSGPASALVADESAVYSVGDADGDGVIDVRDAYPNDSTRAVVARFPTSAYHVLGFEDLYPTVGDADYNDAVVVFAFEQVTNTAGEVKDIGAVFHLIARGSAFDHLLGLHLPGWDGLDDRPPWLPEETGPGAFLDDEGNPWMIVVPYDWCFPLEQVPVWAAYLDFDDWVAAGGTSHNHWYHEVNPDAPWLLGNYAQTYLKSHDWQVDLPEP